MGKRGRLPEGARLAWHEAKAPSKPQAPRGIGAEAAKVWRCIVAEYPEGYFLPGDFPLLVAYCQEAVRLDRAENALASMGDVIETGRGPKVNPWLAVRTASNAILCAIATKLRICANSRTSGKAAAKIGQEAACSRQGLLFS